VELKAATGCVARLAVVRVVALIGEREQDHLADVSDVVYHQAGRVEVYVHRLRRIGRFVVPRLRGLAVTDALW
jgi:hypothetical protein